MTTRDEQTERKFATGKALKRWTAPEMARLDFPKTAATTAVGSGTDAIYGVFRIGTS
jgi:hypothetical protein